jgi:sporulation integral membrane protein YtvI
MYSGTKQALHIILWTALGLAGLYAALRWLLPWTAPFLIAAILAGAVEPAVSHLCRRRWPRAAAAGVCTVVLLGTAGAGLWLLIDAVLGELRNFLLRLPALTEGLSRLIGQAGDWLQSYAGRFGVVPGAWLTGLLEDLPAQLSQLLPALSGGAWGFLSGLAGRAPAILLFLFTVCLGVYFISASYPDIRRFIERQLPLRWRGRAADLIHDLKNTLGRWLKAQLVMIGITFVELLLAFLLLRVDYALLAALIVAFIDALPVLGAGTVLLPWAAVEFLTGSYPLGLGLVITYGVVTLIRQGIQAKLLGDHLGLHPVVSLLAVYAGFRAMGIWGMLLFPLLFVTVKQLNDRGVLRLWHTEGTAPD